MLTDINHAIAAHHAPRRVRAQDTDAAMKSIEWVRATAFPNGIAYDNTFVPCRNPAEPLDVTLVSRLSGGMIYRGTNPVLITDLALADIEVGLLFGELVAIRYQSDAYRHKHTWATPDEDNPVWAQWFADHGMPHRYYPQRTSRTPNDLDETDIMSMVLMHGEAKA